MEHSVNRNLHWGLPSRRIIEADPETFPANLGKAETGILQDMGTTKAECSETHGLLV